MFMNNIKKLWKWFRGIVLSKEFIIALMVLIGTVMTIQGGLEEQRVVANREMKQMYYNQFMEAYTNKMIADSSGTRNENIDVQFNLEVNRLPLYASQEMIEHVEKLKNPKPGDDISAKRFYEIMRRDLCSEKFIKFKDLPEITFTIPSKVEK